MYMCVSIFWVARRHLPPWSMTRSCHDPVARTGAGWGFWVGAYDSYAVNSWKPTTSPENQLKPSYGQSWIVWYEA